MNIEKSAQEIFNEHHKSVVLIMTRTAEGSSLGTGFIIGGTEGRYLVMTCQHVIRSDSECELTIRLPGDTTEYKADKLHECVDSDLAIIEVRGVTRECPPLLFGDSDNLAYGTVVFRLGYVLPTRLEGSSESPAKTLFPSVTPLTISIPLQQNGPGGMQDIVCIGPSMPSASGSPVMLGHDVIGIQCLRALGSQTLFSRASGTVNVVLKEWLNLQPNDPQTTKEMIEKL